MSKKKPKADLSLHGAIPEAERKPIESALCGRAFKSLFNAERWLRWSEDRFCDTPKRCATNARANLLKARAFYDAACRVANAHWPEFERRYPIAVASVLKLEASKC